MDLREYVKSTLLDLMNGVADARLAAKKAREEGQFLGEISPDVYRRQGVQGSSAEGFPIHEIRFKVRIHVEESTTTTGGGGLRVASVLSVGGQRGDQRGDASTQVVKFKVPITWPA